MLKKLGVLLFGAAIVGAITLTGCHVPLGSSGGSSATSPTSATSILENLGVGAVTSPPPATVKTQTGATVTVNPSTWQPLKNRYAVFTPQAEVFQAGGSAPATGSTSLVGDGTIWNSFYEYDNDTSSIAVTSPFVGGGGAGGWDQTSAKTSVAADLTGNGIDNIVVFYVNSSNNAVLKDIVYSPPSSGSGKGSFGASHTVSGVTLNTASDETVFGQGKPLARSSVPGIGTPWFPYLSCTKADLNGNGIDEILLADYNTLYGLSVDPSGSVTLLFALIEPYPISSVAAGDYNGSGRDDFVVGLEGPSYVLYDSRHVTVTSSGVIGESESPVEATFGDFYGNGMEELALCAQASDGNIVVSMYNFSGVGVTAGVGGNPTLVNHFEDNLNPFEANPGTDDYYRMVPRAIDITGTGTDALSVLGSIYEQPMGNASGTIAPLTGTPAATYAAGSYSSATAPVNTAAAYPNAGDNTVVDMEVGNVNSGGLGQGVTNPAQDLIVLSVSEYNVPGINVFGLNSSGDFKLLETLLQEGNSSKLYSIDKFGTSTTMAVGNFEDNAPRVEYVGHKLTFTDPIVIAALASPPYWSDIVAKDEGYANAYTGWNTTFGETKANSSDSSTSVAFSVGSEIEFNEEISIFGINIANFQSSVAFTNTNTWEWGESKTREKYVQYNCPAGENMVVFTSIPMDQYTYRIVSSPDPTTSPVGSELHINIPRQYTPYFVTQAYFNSHINTNIVQPVGSSVLGFTIGDPATYPSYSSEQSLMSSAFGAMNWSNYEADYQIGPKPVAEGTDNITGGSTNLQITNTTGTSETISHDFSLDTSVGGGAGSVTVLATAGFQTGYSTTSTVNTSTSFGGTVGYLPQTYYDNSHYNYSAGLFVYPHKTPAGNIFWVVNYYVTQ